ncbi:MAG: thermosome subunit alpha [Nanoarchaeota archaeon]|nr:thermosome subunit alpha [Nanoarchaeota archaeon]
MSRDIQPIFILPENTQRTVGKNAQRTNIMAARMVAETVRTTLGPKGMDKMIVDSLGDITVTNDGVTILEEIQIEHPSAKMIVEVAKTQENEVGDGTTTAVVLAGELLKNAEYLLDKAVHPTVIARGYRLAEAKVQEILNEIAETINIEDNTILNKISMTAMTGKGAESSKELLSDIAVKAVKLVMDKENGISIDKENIKLEKKVGGAVQDTELIEGIVLDKERVNSNMPNHIEKAKIALIDSAIEIKNTEMDAKIQITQPGQIQSFIDQEEQMLRHKVEMITASGANVLICQKGIDDLAQYFLAKQGVFAIRRAKQSDMQALARATGARIVNNLEELSKEDIGFAGVVEEVKVGDENMTYIRNCKNPKSVTILIRGGTAHVVDEVKRAMEDALGDITAAIKNTKVVAGAGAIEIELARQLKSYADSLSGREQLAVHAFATAIEILPTTLAENAGLDPIDVLAELKSAHDKGKKWAGINVFTGKVMDAWKEGVIEPARIKTQAFSSATEVAVMILRIDDVIAGGSAPAPRMPPPGMDMGM